MWSNSTEVVIGWCDGTHKGGETHEASGQARGEVDACGHKPLPPVRPLARYHRVKVCSVLVGTSTKVRGKGLFSGPTGADSPTESVHCCGVLSVCDWDSCGFDEPVSRANRSFHSTFRNPRLLVGRCCLRHSSTSLRLLALPFLQEPLPHKGRRSRLLLVSRVPAL